MKFSTYAEYKSYFSRDAQKRDEESHFSATSRRTVLGLDNRSELDAMIRQVNRKSKKQRRSAGGHLDIG